MNFPGKIFFVSALIMFLGWIAKMHFIPGGDYLFRIGTIGIVTSLIIQIHNSVKIPDVKSNNLTKLFLLNLIICMRIQTSITRTVINT